jgi:putative DNA primase/helicase
MAGKNGPRHEVCNPLENPGGAFGELIDKDLALPQTELGNAERYRRDWQGRQLYCHEAEGWLIWDGTRWAPDCSGTAQLRAAMTVRRIEGEVAPMLIRLNRARHEYGKDSEEVKMEEEFVASRKKWARTSESKRHIDAAESLARSFPALSVRGEKLDRKNWLFNCANGTYDLAAGRLRPSDPADLLTQVCDAAYRPDAQNPVWDKFLRQTFVDEKGAFDAELCSWVQRAVGMSLVGHQSDKDQVFIFGFGNGVNGKGTFYESLSSVLGDYCVQMAPNTLVKMRNDPHPTDVYFLKNKRLAFSGEIQRGEVLDEAKMKRLSGGDTVTARKMRSNFEELIPSWTFFLNGNHLPTVSGTDKGFWRRFRLLPFLANLALENIDLGLRAKILAEPDGVLRWALDGCRAWMAEGLGTCAAVTKATAAYRGAEDHWGRFLAEVTNAQIDVGGKAFGLDDGSVTVTKKTLRLEAEAWYKSHGFRTPTDRFISSEMSRLGVDEDKNCRPRAWIGLKVVHSFREQLSLV